MCGIAGLAGERDRFEAGRRVSAMVRALERRGPDGEGLEIWDRAALGHRRLAIFDLTEAGRQPMISPDGSVGVTFNGAIYNFLDLRRELVDAGYSFNSHTDTEVLIHGYNEWGLDRLVSKLDGMFAFGLWDDRTRKLFLVRDRLGVKPLVYSVGDRRIAFASTPRALRAGGFVGEIEEYAMAEYLEFGFVTDARSIYKGAIKVPAASIVEWSEARVSTRSYWSTSEISTSPPSFDEAVEETERLFLKAVEKRLHADVAVGALLSGGVDSSLVCWAISRLGGDVEAFTVGTPGDPWDETEDARATAAALKIKHRVLELFAADAPDVTELVSAYAEPFSCASALGMLTVSRAVRSSATVLLTGDGGDDVFLGYPEHRNLWLAGKLARSLPNGATRVWSRARSILPESGILRRGRSFVDFATGGLGAVAAARDGLPMYQRKGLLGERVGGLGVDSRTIPWSHDSARRVLADFLEHDRRTRFTGEYLTKVDGATMHHALEARSPFLDQNLWEFASALPFDLRLRGGKLKAVLRELARRHIGDRVARGSKRGFGIPVQRWVAGRWRDRVKETLANSLLQQEGWIESKASLAQLDIAVKRGWAPNQLWYIFVLESWLRREQEESPTGTPAHLENPEAIHANG
jgi:asparagine synthase (glutamine-hydrolysing)